MKKVIFEKATTKDIPFIIKGINEIYKIEKQPSDKRSVLEKKIKIQIKQKQIIVAKIGEKTIGFLEFLFSKKEPYGINYDDEKEKYCWVNNMYVKKELRGLGIGKLFFKELKKICKDKKIKRIMLDVFEVNENGKKFYKKTGFKQETHIMEEKLK
jgi:GNAT superfamily N-acetyltransferase